jgi:hypothetical protein
MVSIGPGFLLPYLGEKVCIWWVYLKFARLYGKAGIRHALKKKQIKILVSSYSLHVHSYDIGQVCNLTTHKS